MVSFKCARFVIRLNYGWTCIFFSFVRRFWRVSHSHDRWTSTRLWPTNAFSIIIFHVFTFLFFFSRSESLSVILIFVGTFFARVLFFERVGDRIKFSHFKCLYMYIIFISSVEHTSDQKWDVWISYSMR